MADTRECFQRPPFEDVLEHPVPGENTVTSFDAELTVAASGHYVQLFAEQTSGGPISIDRSISFLIAEPVGQA